MHKTLLTLQKNNPEIELQETPNMYIVRKAWADDSFGLLIRKNTRIPNMDDIFLLPEFSSILNLNINRWEFIFSVVPEDSNLVKRDFRFNYKGNTFNCYFDDISNQLKFFAKSFIMLQTETETTYRNLRTFKDFFNTTKPDYVKEYYKDKISLSFYIEGPIDIIIDEKIEFAKTLNFYLTYYDRESPLIQVFPKEKDDANFNLPCYSLFDKFPESINASKIDLTLLDIINVAHKTQDVRLEFIFYYQVIEYAAYYYLENDDRRKLTQILKRPDVNTNSVNYSREIIEVLSEHFNVHKKGDKEKFNVAIKSHCDIQDLVLELEQNQEEFKKEIVFDGGLKLTELFKDISAIKLADKGVMNQIITNIGKIRNVIVHLRESRENTVILPTERNNKLLMPYLFLLKRIAEKVVIQFE